jgi:hypothetical protein
MTAPRDTETWNRIVRLYQQGVTISQLSVRFELTDAGIRDGLKRAGILRKRKNQHVESAANSNVEGRMSRKDSSASQ